MNEIKIDSAKTFLSHFDALAKIGRSPEGLLRAAWSDEESEAMEYIRRDAEKANLISRYDNIGNLFISMPGVWDKYVVTGSHLDTVPDGGNFDGVAGVVAGLESIKSIYNSKLRLSKGLKLVIWRGEESTTYNVAYKGSKVAFGFPFKDVNGNLLGILDNKFKGQTLEDAINNQSRVIGKKFDPSYFSDNKSTLSQKEIDSISDFIELHIEQGKKLEKDGDDIGIVTSIRAPIRLSSFLNQSGYDDIRLSNLLVALDKLAMQEISEGNDLVKTVGVINTDFSPEKSLLKNCAITKVSGYSEVRLNTGYRVEKRDIELISDMFNVEIINSNTNNGVILKIHGDFDHSGATPMGREYRRDANLAAAYLVKMISEKNSNVKAKINYPDNAYSNFKLDIRSNNKSFRDSNYRKVIDVLHNYGILDRDIHLLDSEEPVEKLDKKVQSEIETVCKQLGYRYQFMSSGAGHDAAVIAKQQRSDGSFISSNVIFIPCKDGRSHCSEEYVKPEANVKGLKTLAYTLYRLAR